MIVHLLRYVACPCTGNMLRCVTRRNSAADTAPEPRRRPRLRRFRRLAWRGQHLLTPPRNGKNLMNRRLGSTLRSSYVTGSDSRPKATLFDSMLNNLLVWALGTNEIQRNVIAGQLVARGGI